MYQKKYDRKNRLSSFLPYGVISGPALALTVRKEETFGQEGFDFTGVLYDPETPMQKRVQAVEKAHITKQRHVRNMEKAGLIFDKPITFGKRKTETVSCYRLSLAAFFYLTCTACEAEDNKKVKTNTAKNQNRKTRSMQPTEEELARIDAINYLNDLAIGKDSTPESAACYHNYLLDSVREHGLSPLAMEPLLARNVTLTPYERGRSLYRNYRLANIETLFRESGFLTSIDRRHITCVQVEDNPELKKQDIKWFCKYVLPKWYRDNPDFYYFLQEAPDVDPKARELWQTNPAFYSVQDIPGFYSLLEDKKTRLIIPEMNIPGTNQLLRHTCDGIAIGTRVTYIVHHTRPTETPWYIGIEKNTIQSAEMIFKRLKMTQSFLGSDRHIRNAIIVCPSVHHFAELFTKKPKGLPGQWDTEKMVSRPYDNANIVLLNSAGTNQLWYLMKYSPIHYDEMVKRFFLKKFDGFSDRPKSGRRKNDIFALSYNRTPVFLAHSLNWQNLYWAKEKYDEGEKFYVCCYPEQVKFIQKIMPNVEFL